VGKLEKMFGKVRNIHFVGIGGIGMSGLAEILNNLGFNVQGSDISDSANVKRLRAMGIKIEVGHRQENAKGADVVVHTSAVGMENPELVYAEENYIPIIKRGEMLAELMKMKFNIAISGSHGKTTTTSLVGHIFNKAKLDPTVVVGGIVNKMETNATLGSSNVMIAEADESDRSFLMLQPSIAVITNIDYEHPDTYSSLDDVKDTFVDFAAKVPFYGLIVMCLDDDNTADIIPKLHRRFTTYGIQAQADVRGRNLEKEGFATSFDVQAGGEDLGRIKLALPGEHNVLNALAAIAVALEFDIPFETIKEALADFNGVQRRLTVRYEDDSCVVMDDYGHHPTEIKTTLKAVRDAYPGRKITAVFQPHRYTRTQALMKEFATCFFDANKLILTDIYAASEEPIEGVNSEALVKDIKEHGFKNVSHVSSFDEVYPVLEETPCEEMVVLTLGAGSITKFSHELAEWVKGKRNEK